MAAFRNGRSTAGHTILVGSYYQSKDSIEQCLVPQHLLSRWAGRRRYATLVAYLGGKIAQTLLAPVANLAREWFRRGTSGDDNLSTLGCGVSGESRRRRAGGAGRGGGGGGAGPQGRAGEG